MTQPNLKSVRRASVFMVACLLAFPPLSTAIAPASAAESIVTLRGDPAAEADERERLLAALKAAANAREAAAITGEIWSLWFRAPNAEAAKLMEEALDRRGADDHAGSIAALDKLVEAEPGWAEAWNQRATMRYVIRDYHGSLADIDRVLQLEPKHFGALSGQAIILMRQGRMEEGQAALRRAVDIDPFLSERALLMQPPGKDI
jgi:tetratricopeptide (TPR) repeat protein